MPTAKARSVARGEKGPELLERGGGDGEGEEPAGFAGTGQVGRALLAAVRADGGVNGFGRRDWRGCRRPAVGRVCGGAWLVVRPARHRADGGSGWPGVRGSSCMSTPDGASWLDFVESWVTGLAEHVHGGRLRQRTRTAPGHARLLGSRRRDTGPLVWSRPRGGVRDRVANRGDAVETGRSARSRRPSRRVRSAGRRPIASDRASPRPRGDSPRPSSGTRRRRP